MTTELTSMLHILPTRIQSLSALLLLIVPGMPQSKQTMTGHQLYTRNFIALGLTAVSLAKSILQAS